MTILSSDWTQAKPADFALNEGMNHILALSSGQLTQANSVGTGRMAAFARIVDKYGQFLVDEDRPSWERAVPSEGRAEVAMDLYREANEEQRTAIDDLMKRRPNFRTYSALMEALLRDSENKTRGAFDRVVSFYDDISAIAGIEGERKVFETCERQRATTDVATGDKQTKAYSLVLAVTTMCAFNLKDYPWLLYYVTHEYSALTAPLPSVVLFQGTVYTLRPEYANVIKEHPEQVPAIASAMKRSQRMLGADELVLVASGDQPVSLVEGML